MKRNLEVPLVDVKLGVHQMTMEIIKKLHLQNLELIQIKLKKKTVRKTDG